MRLSLMKCTAGGMLALALTACGGDSSTAPDRSYVGSYTLVQVNGSSLPTTISQTATEKDEVTGGGGSINADGTYSFTFNWRITTASGVSTTTNGSVGTWTQANAAFQFRDNSDGTTVSGGYANHKLTLLDEGISLVFQHN